MNIWHTFRIVPPVSLNAMAWATLSFATYLAAVDLRPSLWGRDIDPLALALAVQMTLSVTNNMTSDRFVDLLRSTPDRWIYGWALFCVIVLPTSFAALALNASSALTAKLFIVYYAAHGLILACAATSNGTWRRSVVGSWTYLKKHATGAIMLEAVSRAITALTLFTVWTYAGPLAFAAMMSFGVLGLWMLSNWIIVLYLLDAEQRASDE